MRLDHDQSQGVPGADDDDGVQPEAGSAAGDTVDALDACANIFVGITEVGQPCQFAMECEKGAHCVFNKLTPTAGVCEPYQKQGDICNANTDCDPSVPQLYCAQQD